MWLRAYCSEPPTITTTQNAPFRMRGLSPIRLIASGISALSIGAEHIALSLLTRGAVTHPHTTRIERVARKSPGVTQCSGMFLELSAEAALALHVGQVKVEHGGGKP